MNEVQHLLGLLEKAGLSQTALAQQTGIPQPRLSRWARGKVPVGARDALKLKALCDRLAPPVEQSESSNANAQGVGS